MPTDIELTRLSKMLSFVLRHQPSAIGLVLDPSGWADTGDLIEKMNGHGYSLTVDLLHQVVATSDKKRFSFNEDGTRVRAAQGHSVEVDLQLQAVAPPPYLYHGTGRRAVASIQAGGLQKRKRHHVHLSADLETAVKVGRRHGAPKVFVVKSGDMHSDGYSFYLSENGVWLVDEVPPRYLVLLHS